MLCALGQYPPVDASWVRLWAFPWVTLSADPVIGLIRRYHALDQSFQRSLNRSVEKAGIIKRAAPRALCHAFAMHLLQSGYDIRAVQALLGQSNVATTMIYTDAPKLRGSEVRSPLNTTILN